MTLHRDAADLETTSDSAEAVAAYDQALVTLLEYRLEAGQHAKRALQLDPAFPMGHVFRGCLLMQLGTTQIHSKVRESLALAKQHYDGVTRREQLHMDALGQWVEGNVHAACEAWEQVLLIAPGDLLALRLHHFMSFWQGARGRLRDAPAASIGQLDEGHPAYGFALGMYAFGLEENGDYARAEALGRNAVELNADDLWAVHAVAHVLEMQCRHEDGAKWLSQPTSTWSDRNPFKDHVWWHTALFALELQDYDRVFALYDEEIRVDEAGFYLDLQNAASLLMRLELLGVDVGTRWEPLGELAESRLDDHQMPFTDAHFMLALIGAKNIDSARAYLRSLSEFAGTGGNDAAKVTASTGLPLAGGLLAFAEADYALAVAHLLPLRHRLAPLGGSHAQQDLFSQILIEAACRSGQTSLARALLCERIVNRPGTFWAKHKLEALDAA